MFGCAYFTHTHIRIHNCYFVSIAIHISMYHCLTMCINWVCVLSVCPIFNAPQIHSTTTTAAVTVVESSSSVKHISLQHSYIHIYKRNNTHQDWINRIRIHTHTYREILQRWRQNLTRDNNHRVREWKDWVSIAIELAVAQRRTKSHIHTANVHEVFGEKKGSQPQQIFAHDGTATIFIFIWF